MASPPRFEGPDRTLFLLEGTQIRVVTSQGQEALVRVEDFVELLLHLAGQRGLASSFPHEVLKERLAAVLT